MTRRILFIAALAASLVACSSAKTQTEADGEAKANQAVTQADKTAKGEAESDQKSHADEHGGDHAKHEKHAQEGEDGPRGHRFTEPEKYAERWNDPARDKWQKPGEVMTVLGVEKGMTVVDLGTGTGYFVPHLAKTVGPTGKVLALDVEEPMVEYVKNRVLDEDMDNVEARVVAYDDPGLSAESVDRVLTVNTWHHIQNREAYVEKLASGLKPGGTVAVVDYTLDSPHGPPRDHKLDPEQVKEELEAGGLSAQIVEEDLPRQYVVIGRKTAEK